WATHFIAMLAFESGFPTAYDPFMTAGSFVIAVFATTLGFVISADERAGFPAFGGVVIGAGIGLMHYIGMQALIMPGGMQWDAPLVVASLVIGGVCASAAMTVFHGWRARSAHWIAASLFALAICGLHFTAMGAAEIVLDPTLPVPPSPISD